MRIIALATLLYAVCADYAPPRVTVDLGLDPEHRWDHIVVEHKDAFLRTINEVFSRPPVKYILPMARLLIGNAVESRRLLPGDQILEAKGIARELGVGFADVVLVGVFYDLFAAADNPLKQKACTGIVSQSASGEIIHGRNLDYDFADALKNSTLVVDFARNGSVLFTAVTFGPNPSFNTVVRWGSWSLSQNERDTGSVLNNLWDMLILGRPAVFARVRQAAEEVSSFEDVVKFFSTVKLDAAAYFIIGGTKAGEGAVVTRDRASPVDVWRLDASAGRWYLVETNYDHQKAPHWGDNRRQVVERAMNLTGAANITPDTMWEVISVTQVNTSAGERAPLNNETIYSTIMQAATPATFKTLVRSHTGMLRAPAHQPSHGVSESAVVV